MLPLVRWPEREKVKREVYRIMDKGYGGDIYQRMRSMAEKNKMVQSTPLWLKNKNENTSEIPLYTLNTAKQLKGRIKPSVGKDKRETEMSMEISIYMLSNYHSNTIQGNQACICSINQKFHPAYILLRNSHWSIRCSMVFDSKDLLTTYLFMTMGTYK